MKKIEVYIDANLKPYNTFHIGGNAKYIFVVYDTDTLQKVCIECKHRKIMYKVIGRGSNLLFDDSGYDGAIIVNRASVIRRRKNTLTISSGTEIATLINYSMQHSLSGVETYSGIPATIGGAITNNMGAFGVEIGELVTSVKCFDKNNPNEILTLRRKQCDFKYRHSVFQSNRYVILSVKIKLRPADQNIIREKALECLNKKLTTQPMNKYSAGSVFKRTEKYIPAKIIDELGLKGYSIGGASVSKKHAGFIINNRHAKASDVLNLIEYINMAVFDRYCVTFTPEIEFVKNND